MRFRALRFFDGNNALFAHSFHRFSEHQTDRRISVGADLPHLRDCRFVLCGGRELFQLRNYDGHSGVDAALDTDRTRAGFDQLEALDEDRLSENGRGRRSVTGFVTCPRRDFANHLRAHVLELVV